VVRTDINSMILHIFEGDNVVCVVLIKPKSQKSCRLLDAFFIIVTRSEKEVLPVYSSLIIYVCLRHKRHLTNLVVLGNWLFAFKC